MKFAAAKTKKRLLGLSSCLAIAMVLVPAAAARADSYPYFKEYGADVSAGGWFNGGATGGCINSPDEYQYPGFGTPPSQYAGGILTYGKSTGGGNAAGGASSQYGAFALGAIDSTTGTPSTGFYSSGAQTGSAVSQLSFANIGSLPSNSSGGNYGGGTEPADQCIPDYYDDAQQGTPTALPVSTSSLSALTSGQYSVNAAASGGTLTLNASTISAGQNIALFVKGNVYINGNILYATHNIVASASKFALVVSGNIYINHTVSELDGWYIAQPAANGTTATDDGLIWTCYDTTTPTNSNYGPWMQANCGSTQLVVNGALTAKHVNFTRTAGDSTVASTSSDGANTADANAAEVINYTPDMILGGPFFDLSPATPKIESLVSLPPVF